MSFTSTWGLHGGLIPGSLVRGGPFAAHGLMLRGAVIATYCVDEEVEETGAKSAVFCDVYLYSTMNGARYGLVRRAPVSQDRGAVHDGSPWIPKSASVNLADAAISADLSGMNPADLNGEHVLVGFIDDDLRQPIVLRGIPHPKADFGKSEGDVRDHVAPETRGGYTRLTRHNGTVFGVDGAGNFSVSTEAANAGVTTQDGQESPVDPDGLMGGVGDVSFVIKRSHTFSITILNRQTEQETRVHVGTTGVQVDAQGYSLSISSEGVLAMNEDNVGFAVRGVGPAAVAVIGDGGETDPNATGDPLGLHVPIVERLQALYTSLKAAFDTHTHAIAPGAVAGTTPVTGSVLAPGSAAPAWDAAINSTKVRIPG